MLRRYADALRFLNRFTDYERMASSYASGDYTLDRMRRLVAALGHPERAFLSVHIAGTKGKGSTAHIAEAILREAGYRTGLYTSPHLVDMRERIRLGGIPVSERDFTAVMAEMEPELRRLRPTYFETMTAAAFLLFARKGVQYAVIEVGLGGRLDATNVILPAACAITTIDYDHMDKLGKTLTKIAGEKAGILKPGVPAVSSPQPPEARRVLLERGPIFFPRFRVLPSAGFVLKFMVDGPHGHCAGGAGGGKDDAGDRASGAPEGPAARARGGGGAGSVGHRGRGPQSGLGAGAGGRAPEIEAAPDGARVRRVGGQGLRIDAADAAARRGSRDFHAGRESEGGGDVGLDEGRPRAAGDRGGKRRAGAGDGPEGRRSAGCDRGGRVVLRCG
jgi:hypothetical protein